MSMDFGKLDFAVSFNRLTAFPLDAKSYFETYTAANAAAATAEGAGSSNTTYFFGQTIAVVENNVATLYIIQPDKTLKQVGPEVILDEKVFVKGSDGTISLKGFADAVAGAQLTVGADGFISWVKPDTTTVEGLSSAVSTLQDTVGDSTKGLVKDVADIKTTIGADDTAGLRKEIKANKDAIAVLNGDEAGSVKKIVDDAINKFATDVSDDKVVNSYKELIDWVATHGSEATEMADAITALQAIVKGIGGTGEKATVITYVEDAISTALTNGDYATATNLTALANRVKAIEDSDYAKITATNITKWNNAEQNAKNYTDTKIGDLGKVTEDGADHTVKTYVDAKNAELTNSISSVNNSLKKLAKLDEVSETELSTALATKINNKADKGTTLAAYTIGDAYTKTEVNNLITSAKTEVNGYTDNSITAAKSELVGTASGENASNKDDSTIEGAKRYADQVLKDAKSYADGIVTGESGISKKVSALEAKHAEGKTVAEEVEAGIAAIKLSENYASKSAFDEHVADTVKHITADERTKWNKVATDVDKLNGEESAAGSVKAIAKSYADGKNAAIAEAKAAGDNAQIAVDNLSAKVGTVPADKTIVQMITDATYDDAAIKADIKKNTDDIGVLNGSETIEGSVKKTVNDAINDFATKISEDGTVNTFKELVDYVAEHGSQYTDAIADIAANKSAIGTLNGTGAGSVKKTVDDAISALNIDDYAKSADVESAYVKKETGKSLISDDLITKLTNIDTTALSNKIEKITVNGTEQTITEKTVALESYKGDGTSIENDTTNHTLSIKSVSTDLLAQGVNTLILNGGTAAIL